jgi:hypothetical protein
MKNLPGLIYIDLLVYLTVNRLISKNLEGLIHYGLQINVNKSTHQLVNSFLAKFY